MIGGGTARVALAGAVIALAAALGACGGGDSGSDARAAPLKRGHRDPANFLIVVDSSAAMAEDGRLDAAREGIAAFVRELPADDGVGLAAYSQRFRPLVPISRVRGNRQALAGAVARLEAGGGSALYDAGLEAYGILRELAGSGRIDGVLLIAHSPDSGSDADLAGVRRLLAAQRGSLARVRVITVAYDADGGVRDALSALASASGGKAYESGKDDLEGVLRRAWSGL
jgi:Ca-activated chloride channel family protein